MTHQFELENIPVEVVLKKIKNLHLSVSPPAGQVRVTAPFRMDLDDIRSFAVSKLDWIKKQQKKIQAHPREAPLEYAEGEQHWVWGEPYLLRLNPAKTKSSVELTQGQLVMNLRASASRGMRRDLLNYWYGEEIQKAALPLIAKWEAVIGVKVDRLSVQKMKTKWGSCHYRKRVIRLNSDLARRPAEHLEYVVIHELAHLLEPSHNARFKSLMDRFCPSWRQLRKQLNHPPAFIAARGPNGIPL